MNAPTRLVHLPFVACVLGSLLAGCIAPVAGNGEASSERHELAGFDTLRTYGSIDLVATVDANEAVSVTCDSNLHRHLDIHVEGSELIIDTEPGVTIMPRTDCVAEVTVARLIALSSSGSGSIVAVNPAPDIREIKTSGSGNVTVDDVGSDNLTVRTTGSGDLSLAGAVGKLNAKTTGSGEIDARDLEAQHVVVRTTGSGDVAVFASETVDVRTTGSGDVDVWGLPDEHHDQSTGSGDVRYHW